MNQNWYGQPPQGWQTGPRLQVNVYVQSDTETAMVQVQQFPFRIGRDSNSVDLPLADTRASRIHAQLSLYGNSVILEDMRSSNGTWINGQRITGPVELRSGDQFTIGSSRLTIEIYDD